MSSFKWNPNAERQITAEVMKNLARKGEQRLRSVTCPVHHSSHPVTWRVQRGEIEVSAAAPCCDEVQRVLNEEARKALR
jgi:hypothetical protein